MTACEDLGMFEIAIAQNGAETSDGYAESIWIEPKFPAKSKTETRRT